MVTRAVSARRLLTSLAWAWLPQMVPMALLAGVLAMAALAAVVPGTPGTCET